MPTKTILSPKTRSPRADAAIAEQAASWKARADAGLSPEEHQELVAWQDADPRHAAALARYDVVWDQLDRPFQAGAADALMQELAGRARARRRRRMVSAAAGLAVLLGIVSLWRVGVQRETAAGPVTPNAVLLLPQRQVLADGSVVELKPGARIRENFSAGFRRVELLAGEAHFKVTKDATRPFIVAAEGVEARAVGTAFTVDRRKTAVEVLVTEGRVAVNREADLGSATSLGGTPSAPAPLAVLEVGKSIVVETAGSKAPPQVVALPPEEMADRLAWRSPRVEFSRTTLGEAVALLNGYAAARRAAGEPGAIFVLADPALADVRVSGLFRVDRTDAFVELLQGGFGIEAESRGEHEILLRKAK